MDSCNENDSIDKIQRDLMAVIRRAVNLGERQAVARLVAAAYGQTAQAALISPSDPASPDTARTIDVAVAEGHTARVGGRAPQGSVKALVREIVFAHQQGIGPNEIDEAAERRKGIEIKPSSRRMALLTLKASGEVVQRDGKWFPANAAGDTVAVATESLFDLQDVEVKPATAT
jgi:hypothetical protein